jgi:hypothetical protein
MKKKKRGGERGWDAILDQKWQKCQLYEADMSFAAQGQLNIERMLNFIYLRRG